MQYSNDDLSILKNDNKMTMSFSSNGYLKNSTEDGIKSIDESADTTLCVVCVPHTCVHMCGDCCIRKLTMTTISLTVTIYRNLPRYLLRSIIEVREMR